MKIGTVVERDEFLLNLGQIPICALILFPPSIQTKQLSLALCHGPCWVTNPGCCPTEGQQLHTWVLFHCNPTVSTHSFCPISLSVSRQIDIDQSTDISTYISVFIYLYISCFASLLSKRFLLKAKEFPTFCDICYLKVEAAHTGLRESIAGQTARILEAHSLCLILIIWVPSLPFGRLNTRMFQTTIDNDHSPFTPEDSSYIAFHKALQMYIPHHSSFFPCKHQRERF